MEKQDTYNKLELHFLGEQRIIQSALIATIWLDPNLIKEIIIHNKLVHFFPQPGMIHTEVITIKQDGKDSIKVRSILRGTQSAGGNRNFRMFKFLSITHDMS